MVAEVDLGVQCPGRGPRELVFWNSKIKVRGKFRPKRRPRIGVPIGDVEEAVGRSWSCGGLDLEWSDEWGIRTVVKACSRPNYSQYSDCLWSAKPSPHVSLPGKTRSSSSSLVVDAYRAGLPAVFMKLPRPEPMI